MAIETIYSSPSDGRITDHSTNWVNLRRAASGTLSSITAGSSDIAIDASTDAAPTPTYNISRVFLSFAIGRITHLPHKVTLKVRGKANNAADMRVVKSNQADTMVSGDYDAIVGWDATGTDGAGGGDNSGNVTFYDTGEITSWSTSGYNSIHLNQQACIDVAGLITFKCCLIENDRDLLDIVPSGVADTNNHSGMYFANAFGTSYDPYLEILTQDNAIFAGATF